MYVKTARLNLHVEIDGPADAIPVVFSNSLGASTAMWQPQVDALCEEFRCIRYDQRGHGQSDVTNTPYAFETLVDDALARVPGSRLIELDAAHVSNLERPAAFSAALREFFRAAS